MSKGSLSALAAIMFFSMCSFAQGNIGGYPDPIPGLKRISEFCSGLRDDDQVIRCFQAATPANYYSANTLRICEAQTWDNEQVNCVSAMINRVVDDAEVDLCSQEAFADDQFDCLKNINRMYPYRTFWKVTREPGSSKATQFCAQFFFDNDKNSCLQTTSSAQFFSPFAVDFCQGFFSDREKLSCIAAVKDRAVLQTEALRCSQVFSDRDKMSCISAIQRKVRLRP